MSRRLFLKALWILRILRESVWMAADIHVATWSVNIVTLRTIWKLLKRRIHIHWGMRYCGEWHHWYRHLMGIVMLWILRSTGKVLLER